MFSMATNHNARNMRTKIRWFLSWRLIWLQEIWSNTFSFFRPFVYFAIIVLKTVFKPSVMQSMLFDVPQGCSGCPCFFVVYWYKAKGMLISTLQCLTNINWLCVVLQTLGLPAATKCFPAAEFYFNAQIKHFLAIKQILFDIIYVLHSHT